MSEEVRGLVISLATDNVCVSCANAWCFVGQWPVGAPQSHHTVLPCGRSFNGAIAVYVLVIFLRHRRDVNDCGVLYAAQNNNAGCGWDGGDCCGGANDYTYCDDCMCRNCTHALFGGTDGNSDGDGCVSQANGECSNLKRRGDGICDDGNNNAGCAWDGGDCCGSDKEYMYCTDCACLDCSYSESCIPEGETIDGVCGAAAFKGDGICDDNNNNAGCGWDGGDCCGVSGVDVPHVEWLIRGHMPQQMYISASGLFVCSPAIFARCRFAQCGV